MTWGLNDRIPATGIPQNKAIVHATKNYIVGIILMRKLWRANNYVTTVR